MRSVGETERTDFTALIRPGWWMGLGERAAIEGLLSVLKPALAVEIGTGEGGSLNRIAAHSREAHSFDFAPRVANEPADVTLHRGDNHVLLPQLLLDFSRRGRNVDFVLVDGDHTAAGVKRDLEDLLASEAVSRTVIVLHDTMNEDVRSGIESVRFEDHPKVVYVDLDFVQSYQARTSPLAEFWGGLGLVVIDVSGTYTFELFRHFRMGRDDRQVVVRDRDWSRSAQSSPAWRRAAPFRDLKRRLQSRARILYYSLRGPR